MTKASPTNVERDIRKEVELMAAGWEVLVVWQCEAWDPVSVAATLTIFLEPRADIARSGARSPWLGAASSGDRTKDLRGNDRTKPIERLAGTAGSSR